MAPPINESKRSFCIRNCADLAWGVRPVLRDASISYGAISSLVFALLCPDPGTAALLHHQLPAKGKRHAAAGFFRITGVPYLRQGLVFLLPGVSIRVAEECSGIRSSLALLITTVLASYLFLRTPWRKLLLCAVVVPSAVLKKGLRIATLSTLSILAIYVDPGFLYGRLHHEGGIVFFMLALVPIALLVMWFQKREKSRAGATKATQATPSPY
jgi:exosortase